MGEKNLFEQLIDVANAHYSGHVTIMKFTTNWRIEFMTPEHLDQDNLFKDWPVGKTFEETAQAALDGHAGRSAKRAADVAAFMEEIWR